MTLAPMPTDAELRRIAADRQLHRFGRVIDPELLDPQLRAVMDDVPTGSRAIALRNPRDTRGTIIAAQTDAGMTAPIRARREGSTLWLEIETAPRTKKNHSVSLYSKMSVPYKKFLQDVIGAVLSVKTALRLPLPDREAGYNIAIRYYVDRYGKRADRPGLDQGLFDALQDAGVVNDDWYFRSTEGTPPPIFEGPPSEGGRPRVEVVITPLAEREDPDLAETPRDGDSR